MHTSFSISVGLEEFIHRKQYPSCNHGDEHLLEQFSSQNKRSQNNTISRKQCERYCTGNRKCWGCSLQCKEECLWNAHSICGNKNTSERSLSLEVSIKPG